jgi:glycosyltransferase involved in cell wall biosynthesis
MKKICIVTTRHISYNPRVLKEADTLYANGYDVSVVTVNNFGPQREFDLELMKSRRWKLATVNFRKEKGGEKLRWGYLSVKQRAYHILAKISYKFGIAERSAEKAFDGLAQLAKKEKADLYLVHHSEALGAGFKAARYNHARLGFDAEDFHTGMNGMTARESSIIYYLEKKYLPHCSYFSAASNGIAKAYLEKYRIKSAFTLLNVFPREPLTVKKPKGAVKFYWYSQVIGPNRGLEMLLGAAGLVDAPFEIHLRGSLYDEVFRAVLTGLIETAGLKGKIFLHEPILAEDIVRDGSNFDVGLALELYTSVNANLCISNKLFSYLMSGLALIMTDTYGQKEIFGSFPEAGRLCAMDNREQLAAAMKFYIDHPDKLLDAKRAARSAAEKTFNWADESQKLLRNIGLVLDRPLTDTIPEK